MIESTGVIQSQEVSKLHISLMKKVLFLMFMFLNASVISGCNTTQAIQLPNNLYAVNQKYLLESEIEEAKKELYSQVNDYAEQKGKTAINVNTINHIQTIEGNSYLEVQFKLVDNYSANNQKQSVSHSGLPLATMDQYQQLQKIGELRAQEILTEEEFLTEKHKLLNKDLASKQEEVESHKPLSKCEAISERFNPLLLTANEDYCSGHSVSFDFYTALDEADCGDFKKLIRISREGYQSACSNGEQNYPSDAQNKP